MKRGVKPKPTALKILQGNPGKRPISFTEPRPQRGAPPAPDWLDPLARAEWDRIVPALDRCGILTVVDGFVLEAYCTAYAHWRRHEAVLAKWNDNPLGHVFNASRDKKKPYMQVLPQVSIAQKYLTMARALAAELGLSPSMRTRIVAPEVAGEKEQDDRLEAILAGKA